MSSLFSQLETQTHIAGTIQKFADNSSVRIKGLNHVTGQR